MSRAFTKEGDAGLDPLPDLPLSPHPNYVTPSGLANLHHRLTEAQARLTTFRARPDRLDKLPEAAAERDIRYFEARLRSAIPVDPANQPLDEVAFGLCVTVEAPDGLQTYQITGEDEASAPQGRIAPTSPLARALIGAAIGDTVQWRKPSGMVSINIVAIFRPESAP